MLGTDFVFDLTTYTLVAMSILTWTIAIAKFIQLRVARTKVQRYERWFSEQLNWQDLQQEPRLSRGDASYLTDGLLAVCAEYARTGQERYTFEQLQTMLSRDLQRKIGLVARAREGWLNALASIGSTAPFLGLFGTVWGIMQALVVIGETGAASITAVAGPIGGALITTAIGIVTAIPAVVFFNLLNRLVRLHLGQLEHFSEQLLRFVLDHRHRWSEVA